MFVSRCSFFLGRSQQASRDEFINWCDRKVKLIAPVASVLNCNTQAGIPGLYHCISEEEFMKIQASFCLSGYGPWINALGQRGLSCGAFLCMSGSGKQSKGTHVNVGPFLG